MLFTSTFSLQEYDPKFKDSFIVLKLFTRAETIKYIDTLIELQEKELKVEDSNAVIDFLYDNVKKHFVSGNIYDEESKKEIDITVDQIDDIPITIIRDIASFLQGSLQKKN